MRKRIVSFLIVILMSGCSGIELNPSDDSSTLDFEDSLLSEIKTNWYKNVPNRFKLESRELKSTKHLFFDVNPLINIKKREMSAVVLTPQASPVRYDLNMSSGQMYAGHKYCSENDIWKKSDSNITVPPYSIGFIPKVYDQLGQPQKVIIFGSQNYISKNHRNKHISVRVIGGYIEQTCPAGKCSNQGEWQSNLVLVAVSLYSKKFERVSSISDLKKIVSWSKVKAFAENGRGHNKLADNFYPAVQIGKALSAEVALDLLKKYSLFFTVKKLTQTRKSCYQLYDYIWKNIGRDSQIERGLRTAKDLKEQARYMDLLKKNKQSAFNHKFPLVFKKYHKNYMTCEKIIYTASINHSPERFWFFSYFTAINLLYSEGYHYDCRRAIWTQSTSRSLNSAFKDCSYGEIDKSFGRALNFLDSLRAQNLRSYRFIDYDKGDIGTHHKLYAWVEVENKSYQCSKGKEIYKTSPIFPGDIQWRKRQFTNLLKSKVIF